MLLTARLYPIIEDIETPMDIQINGKWRLVYSSTFAGQTGGTQVRLLRLRRSDGGSPLSQPSCSGGDENTPPAGRLFA